MSEKIVIPQLSTIHFIDPSHIIYCQSDNCYTNIHILGGKRHLIVKSLSKFAKELCPITFIRVHQSFLVNGNYIQSIDKKRKCIQLMHEHIVPFTMTIKDLLLLISNDKNSL